MKTFSFLCFPFKDERCPSNLVSKIFCRSSVNFINPLIL